MDYKLTVLPSKEYDLLSRHYPNHVRNRIKDSKGFTDMDKEVSFVRSTPDKLDMAGTAIHEILELVSDISPHEEMRLRFKGKDQPQQPQVVAPVLPTADDLFNRAIAWARQNTPLAYGARESALNDLSRGNAYYDQYQPTSFEQALGNQYFQNVMPDVERSIKQNMSLSGLESSPILAQLIGKERGNLGVSIGEYLSNLGNQRASESLNARMSIDPYSTYQNYLGTDSSLRTQDAQNQANVANQNAMIAYQNAIQQYGANKGMATGIGSLIGGGIGFMGGGPAGATLGAGIGGTAGSFFEPNTGTPTKAPISFSDALMYNALSEQGKATPVYSGSNYGTNSFDIQLRNLLQGRGMPQQFGSYSGYYN